MTSAGGICDRFHSSFDQKEIEKAGYKTVTPVIVTNTDNFAEITGAGPGPAEVGIPILTIRS